MLALTDNDLTEDGIICRRKKGSRTNLVLWNKELREAVLWLQERRKQILSRRSVIGLQVLPLFVNQTGDRWTESALDSAWKRAKIPFNPHSLKSAGITDTEGTQAEKQEMGAWKSSNMVSVYDKSIPKVRPVS